MIMGNIWTNYNDFDMELNEQHWQVRGVEGGYLVYVWNDNDDTEDDPVPSYYGFLHNGDINDQDVEQFCPGFKEALVDVDTVFWSHI